MSHDGNDADLKRLFGELKQHDRHRAPAFAAVVAAAEARAARARARRPLRIAAVAATILLLAGGAAAWLRLRHGAGAPEAVAIASWRSPTAWLLAVPGAVALDSVPSVTASVIRPFDSTQTAHPTSRRTGQTKGDTT